MAQENAAPSMEESLNAAIDSVEQAETPPTPAPPVDPVEQETAPAEPQAATATPERARGPDGKFLRRDNVPAAANDTASANEAPVVPDAAAAPAKVAQAAPGAAPPDAAPSTWTPAAKEKWAGLDPTVRGEIQRRERDIAVGMQRAAESRQFGDAVMAEFAPYAEILQQEGATAQGTIRALLETVYTLRYGSPEHKQALFMSLAQQYGIDMGKQIDPEKARLQWEIDSRNINDARYASSQQQALQREVTDELGTFINQPGHEHYDQVRPAMAALIRTGAAQNLQDAYERACWADPSIRQTLQLAANARRVVDQARNRNALATVNGGPGAVSAGGNGVDPTNMRALIEAGFANGAGRV